MLRRTRWQIRSSSIPSLQDKICCRFPLIAHTSQSNPQHRKEHQRSSFFHTSAYILSDRRPTDVHSSPIARYDALVEGDLLRDDSHQRKIVKKLERLHNDLKTYDQIVQPEEDTHKMAGTSGGLVSRNVHDCMISAWEVLTSFLVALIDLWRQKEGRVPSSSQNTR